MGFCRVSGSKQVLSLVALSTVFIFAFNVLVISRHILDPDQVVSDFQQAGVRGAKLFQYKQDKTGHVFHWKSTFNEVEYRKTGFGWEEVQNGQVKFQFEEKSINFKTLSVHLFSRERNMHLVLTSESCSFAFSDPHTNDPGDYKTLYGGGWKSFAGKGPREEPSFSTAGSDRKPPPPDYEEEDVGDVKIILLLAAYRDPLCGNTLAEAFSHAKYPSRIYASVVQQNGEGDLDCLAEYCRIDEDCMKDHIKVMPRSLDTSRGVMSARYQQLLGIEDQEFCLQVDSHSAFEDEWDVIALEDWALTGNEMAVLTTYPNKVGDRHDQRNSPARCSTKFSDHGEIVHGGNSANNVPPGKTPFLVPFFGAGVAFSKCHAHLNVPYDPYMSYLFGGEEFNRAARLFTWGYDMYAPKRNFVYHYYDDEKKPAQAKKQRKRDFFSSNKDLNTQTKLRWRRVLGLPLKDRLKKEVMTDVSLFGLGNRRTLDQYQKFSGVDLINRVAESRCSKLGKMKWVPYDYESPFYPSGNTCKLATHLCCNSLVKSQDRAKSFLQVTNRDLAYRMSHSEPYDDERDITLPIISSMATDTVPLPCP